MIKYLRQYDPECEEIQYLENPEAEGQDDRVRSVR